jgi:hypothetical protein
VRRDGPSEKEAALIAAARRELDARASPRPDMTPARAIAPESAPPAPEAPPTERPDIAARLAALMSAEHEERQRRRRKLRQIGIFIPAIVLVAAILWVASAILRYIRA